MQEEQENPLERYVRAALDLQGYRFDDAQIAEITLAYSRIQAMSETVFGWPMPFGSEAAPAFRP